MPRALQLLLIAIAATGFSTGTFAQEEADGPLRQLLRQALEAAEVTEPTPPSDISIREALADPEVQAALRRHVRGVDVRAPRENLNDYVRNAPTQPHADDGEQGFRVMQEAEIRRLEQPSNDRTPLRAVPADPQRRGSIERESRPPRAIPATPIPGTVTDLAAQPYFDDQLFTDTLHALFANNLNGYVMRMRRNGQTIQTLQWNWAQTPQDGSVGWNPDRRQHVASISKFITAMGLTHLIDAQGIGFDTPIIDYLPEYWQTGPNIEQITFEHLMNHISGFVYPHSGTSSFDVMKNRVAVGVGANAVGNWLMADYENMNFGICRILIAVLAGYIDAEADFGTHNDLVWNWVTTAAYNDYIQDNVFAPAGVTGAVLVNEPDSARAYAWDDTGPGMDSGALYQEAGGAGWHLTADEILDVVGEFRRGGGIMSPQRAQQMLDASFGLNSPIGGWPSPLGNFYFKPGLWWNGQPAAQAEQAIVLILPNNIEIAILVNSPLGEQNMSLQSFAGTLYLLSIVQ